MAHRTAPSLAAVGWTLALGIALLFQVLERFHSPVLALIIWAVVLFRVGTSGARGFFSLESLYLLLLGLFHLGLVVPVTFGMMRPAAASWLDSPGMDSALGLFCLASLAFGLGVALATRRRHLPECPLPARPTLFLGGLFVALIGAAILWIGVFQLGLLTLAYGDYWDVAQRADVRLFGFGLMLLPIGILLAAFASTSRQLKAVTVLYGLTLAPLFLSGFRGHAIVHAVALLVVWLRKEPVLARRLAVGAAAALLIVSPAVRLARNWDRSFADAILEARPIDLLLEMGGSLRPLVATCEMVDLGSEPLWLGRSYVQALGRIVPNVSVDSSQRSGADKTLGPSEWVTMNADPWVYARGGGLGFTGIGEPYLNFGRLGVIVYFFGLGFALRRFDHWLSTDHRFAALIATTFGFLLWTVRNDVMGMFRASALSAVLILVLRLFAKHTRRRTTSIRLTVPREDPTLSSRTTP